ncbi:MAG: hypothetical protein OXM88_09250 [bacterium]|nr:hypothetical protein [bacterium]
MSTQRTLSVVVNNAACDRCGEPFPIDDVEAHVYWQPYQAAYEHYWGGGPEEPAMWRGECRECSNRIHVSSFGEGGVKRHLLWDPAGRWRPGDDKRSLCGRGADLFTRDPSRADCKLCLR